MRCCAFAVSVWMVFVELGVWLVACVASRMRVRVCIVCAGTSGPFHVARCTIVVSV